ncbi:MAG: PH domain-containing protein [Acidobacteriota bacterium]
MPRFAAAPWSLAVRIMSVLGTVVLLVMSWFLHRQIPHGTRVPYAEAFGTAMVAVPPLILLGAALFVVRGYRFEGTALLVERLAWSTRVELAGLERAWHDPAAMCRSVRVFGNGGLYSITGVLRNTGLGTYRAYATDPKMSVVLRTPAKVVVVTPADPEAFLDQVRMLFPRARQF